MGRSGRKILIVLVMLIPVYFLIDLENRHETLQTQVRQLYPIHIEVHAHTPDGKALLPDIRFDSQQQGTQSIWKLEVDTIQTSDKSYALVTGFSSTPLIVLVGAAGHMNEPVEITHETPSKLVITLEPAQ